MRNDVDRILARVSPLLAAKTPRVIALDGRSGVGKSTIAAEIGRVTNAVVIDQDDFYAGDERFNWRSMSAAAKADACIDWRRVRKDVLEPLLNGNSASWHPFNWDTMQGLSPTAIHADPADLIVIDGAYSARPALTDLLDLSVLVTLDDVERRERIRRREGPDWDDTWFRIWDESEDWYFSSIRPPESFDLVLARSPHDR